MKILLCLLLMSGHTVAQKAAWRFDARDDLKKVDVLYNNKLMTSFCYYDSVMKPILFPLNTVSGITVTRGFPIAPVEGDHIDHPHHTGLWMNFENVNGKDFWNNSPAIPRSKRNAYGHIALKQIFGYIATEQFAQIRTSSEWRTNNETVLLEETTDFEFRVTATELIIDRVTTLTAKDSAVLFKDAKDGLLGLRVASELEQPLKDDLEFIDGHGKVTKVGKSKVVATGLYVNSRGDKGDSVWSTRGRWCTLNGKKEGHPISISMIDHPANPGYPTFWHARGYGLFSANPLGAAIFTNGKQRLDLKLAPHTSATFRFRIVIASEKLSTPARVNALADEFAQVN